MNIRINFTNGDSCVWEGFKNLDRFFCKSNWRYYYTLMLDDGPIKEYRADDIKSFEVF